GAIVSSEACPEEITYGDALTYSSSAFLGDVQYEYCHAGSDEWVSAMPKDPGEYQVRAISKATIGYWRGDAETFTIKKRPTTVAVSDTSLIYGEAPSVTAELAPGDTVVCTEFEYENYAAGAENSRATPKTVMILDADGEDATDRYDITLLGQSITVEKRPVTVTMNSPAAWVYDAAAHHDSTFSVTAGSFAVGETLKVTSSTSVTGVTAGTVNEALAWEMSGGSLDNYALTILPGRLSVTPRPVTVISASDRKTYDGEPLTNGGYTVDNLVGGHELSVTVNGSITSALESGNGKNTFDKATLAITAGGESVLGNYTVIFKEGALTVTPRPVTVTMNSHTWTYDGTAHTETGFTVPEDGFAAGEKLVVTSSTSVTNATAGTDNMPLENGYHIEGGNGRVDNYTFTFVKGTLIVEKREITVTSESDEKTYDGTPLTNDGYTVENLVDGHELKVEVTGSITNVSESGNTFDEDSLTIEAGNDNVLENYTVTFKKGTLIVTPRPVTVTSHDAGKIYDGMPLTNDRYTVENLVDGHKLTVEVTGSITNVWDSGDEKNEFNKDSLTIMAGNVDVRENYTVTFNKGSLTVYPRPVTVASASDSKTYDGTPLTNGDYTVEQRNDETESGLIGGHKLTVTVTGSITNVSESGDEKNEFDEGSVTIVTADGDNVLGNYTVTFNKGALTVTPCPVTVTMK
ncbi:MAG: hypothetical protein J6V07_03525, partial [Clostridia bacterium]|nr:hypothetical protein [Clostridia bacterium]